MSSENEKENTFYIGLCMAGAVSAGAYTAGVMDYLLEALAEWEKRKNEPGVPTHKVQIPVIGGASAGGMTSILTSTVLNSLHIPIDKPSDNILAEHPENKFYHTWVDLSQGDILEKMLDTSDIKEAGLVSGLNSAFIDEIAQRVVATEADRSKWRPLPPFIKPGLKIFSTLTNLEGFGYTADFGPGKPQTRKYHMSIHNDYACFELTEENIIGSNGGWVPLNLKDDINVDLARDAAIATGAFPVGLKSRLLNRDASYVNANLWLKKYLTNNPVAPGNYQTLNVDGGLINNEPFEKVRDVLYEITGQEAKDYRDFHQFTSTVVMIDPFPSQKPKPISKLQDLMNVLGLTLSSMINQMRSKPLDIADALSNSCAGQFLVAPSRMVTSPDGEQQNVTGEMAIACGTLNGFGGFLSKEFRVHDYFLGRHNCKIFLRDYFTIPESALQEHPIFKEGYANANLDRFRSTKDGGYQIIPIFAEKTDYTFPQLRFKSGGTWPVVEDQDVDRYKSKLKERIQAILLNVAELSGTSKFLIWAGAKIVLNRVLSNAVLKKIKKDLVIWKLLSEK
ncbi:patatin-like phospholipase family protein [Pedobacter caeni]|uniref:Patatin-like phospholipase n=1 Tax=Pedobacter caeni TaxID=288992 RepID=A0A1M4VAR7_9SPHI|nr:patatin-like phospholipase family protein [Pedobacter caeni]SHE65977.1 Patatin-like phospholipase [Pedobacter caeni]